MRNTENLGRCPVVLLLIDLVLRWVSCDGPMNGTCALGEFAPTGARATHNHTLQNLRLSRTQNHTFANAEDDTMTEKWPSPLALAQRTAPRNCVALRSSFENYRNSSPEVVTETNASFWIPLDSERFSPQPERPALSSIDT